MEVQSHLNYKHIDDIYSYILLERKLDNQFYHQIKRLKNEVLYKLY